MSKKRSCLRRTAAFAAALSFFASANLRPTGVLAAEISAGIAKKAAVTASQKDDENEQTENGSDAVQTDAPAETTTAAVTAADPVTTTTTAAVTTEAATTAVTTTAPPQAEKAEWDIPVGLGNLNSGELTDHPADDVTNKLKEQLHTLLKEMEKSGVCTDLQTERKYENNAYSLHISYKTVDKAAALTALKDVLKNAVTVCSSNGDYCCIFKLDLSDAQNDDLGQHSMECQRLYCKWTAENGCGISLKRKWETDETVTVSGQLYAEFGKWLSKGDFSAELGYYLQGKPFGQEQKPAEGIRINGVTVLKQDGIHVRNTQYFEKKRCKIQITCYSSPVVEMTDPKKDTVKTCYWDDLTDGKCKLELKAKTTDGQGIFISASNQHTFSYLKDPNQEKMSLNLKDVLTDLGYSTDTLGKTAETQIWLGIEVIPLKTTVKTDLEGIEGTGEMEVLLKNNYVQMPLMIKQGGRDYYLKSYTVVRENDQKDQSDALTWQSACAAIKERTVYRTAEYYKWSTNNNNWAAPEITAHYAPADDTEDTAAVKEIRQKLFDAAEGIRSEKVMSYNFQKKRFLEIEIDRPDISLIAYGDNKVSNTKRPYASTVNIDTSDEEAGPRYLLTFELDDEDAASVDYLRVQIGMVGAGNQMRTLQDFEPFYIYLDRQAPTVEHVKTDYAEGWSKTGSYAFSFDVNDLDKGLGNGLLPEEQDEIRLINQDGGLSTVSKIRIGDLEFEKPADGWDAGSITKKLPTVTVADEETGDILETIPGYSITLTPVKNADDQFTGTFNAVFVPDGEKITYYNRKLTITATDCSSNSSSASVNVLIDTVAPKVTGLSVAELEDGKDGERVLQSEKLNELQISLNITDGTESSDLRKIEVQYGDCVQPISDDDLKNTWNNTVRIPLDNRSRSSVIKVTVTDRAGNVGTYYYTRTKKADGTAADAATTDEKAAVSVVTDLQAPSQPDFPDLQKPDYRDLMNNRNWYKTYPKIKVAAADEGSVRSEIRKLECRINDSAWQSVMLYEAIDAELMTAAEISKNLEDGKFYLSCVPDSKVPQKFSVNLCCEGFADLAIPVSEKSFALKDDGELTVCVRAADFGGKTGAENRLTVYIDNSKPNSDETFKPYANHGGTVADTLFGVFFKDRLHVKVKIWDNEGKVPSSGIRDAKLNFAGTDYDGVISEQGGDLYADFKIPQELPENSKVTGTAKITVTDNVGNVFVSEDLLAMQNKSTEITAENIAPLLSKKTVDGPNHYSAAGRDWYSGDVTVSYSVSEPDSGIAEAKFDAAQTGGSTDPVLEKYTQLDKKTTAHDYALKTAGSADGEAKFTFHVTDNAGNSSTDQVTVFKDIQKPYVSGFRFENARSFAEGHPDNLVQKMAERYGHFAQNDTFLLVTVRDDRGASAGISAVYCQLYQPDGTPLGQPLTVKDDALQKDPDGSFKALFMLPEGFKGDIAAWTADNVSNQSEIAFADGFAAENEERHKTTSKLAITLPQTEKHDVSGLQLYKQDVTAAVKIEDSFSGIHRVEWSTSDQPEWQSITIDQNGNIIGGGDGWRVDQTDRNLAVSLSADLLVTRDANGDFIRIRTEDNAGNISEEAVSFSIDKQAPHITVGGLAPSQGTAYYNRDITANVSVAERNFDDPTVNGQADNGFAADPNTQEETDQHVHFKQYTYNTDGKYSLTVDDTDLAGNASDSPFSSGEFVIDKTAPKAALTIRTKDGGTVNTKKNPFVSEGVTAEVTVSELNFNPAGAVITINGQRYTPAANSWKNAQNQVYTLTVPADLFAEDKTYTVAVSVTDLAGNGSGTETAEFTMDTVNPTVEISGVASANKDKVAPLIRTSDVNYGTWELKLTRNGEALTMQQNDADSSFSFAIPGGNTAVTGHWETLDSGRTRSFVFDDFPHKEAADGAYALTASVTDQSGRKTSETKKFTVNRFGSVFTVTDYDAINQKHLSAPLDIEITERNVDLHKEGSEVIVVVDKGSATEQLKADQFTVSDAKPLDDRSGYEYIYSIKAENFEQDLDYKITIRTTDAAGNANVSTNRGAELDFSVDTHIPEFQCDELFDKAEFRESEKVFKLNVNEPLRMIRVTTDDNEVLLEQSDEGVHGLSATSFTFAVPASNSSRMITVELTDLAGNITTRAYQNLLVTENVALYLMHKTWVKTAGAIGAAGAGAAAAFIGLRARRKKKEY